jgi:glycine/D-amino acid oxidase-like deaminating enzyme
MRTAPQPPGTLTHSVMSGLSIRRYPAFRSCPSYPLLLQEPIDGALADYGIHLLFKQAADGSVIIGDSHEYRPLAEASVLEETTNCLINEAILRYARGMLELPSWELQELWNGYYTVSPRGEVYQQSIEGKIHIITGIGGKGMTTGPGFARAHVETLF